MIQIKEGAQIRFEPSDRHCDPDDAEAARKWLASADLAWWRKRCEIAADLDPAPGNQFG
ncbi:MAG: hypothetical protein ACLQHF_12975 [Terracidiphilus sp.]